MVQGVVKPRISDSVYGKCHINLSSEDKEILESQPTLEVEGEEAAPVVVSTDAVDTDDEEEDVAPPPTPAPVPAKKVILKKADPVQAPAPTPAPVAEEPVKKMVVKKKVVTGAAK
jgi:hypothetical protein